MKESNLLKIGLAQISPVWLNKEKTRDKIRDYIEKAGKEGCDLVVFGEALLPGYPFWLGLTHGTEWNSLIQKEIHAHYIRNSITVEAGELDALCEAARIHEVAAYVGIIERAQNRGGHSLYCSLVYINNVGEILSVHRKLQPTYEERLTWSQGDGHGLRVHPLKEFTVGGLNCWENWLPLARTALYGQGEDLHVAVWPGSVRNTEDITRFIAKEARSFVVSVGALMSIRDFPEETPYREEIIKNAVDPLTDGGSCIAGPDGEWILEPMVGKEGLFTGIIDFNRVLEERQNMDVSGHYSRRDVTKLIVNRERQSVIELSQ
ncbi:MAG: carbon-nitrogen hydrolase family protein [Bacteroidia bacterium]|nr:MAG: carbon-nitrogen hydrolase family protein [Bacteroidia bacterium]